MVAGAPAFAALEGGCSMVDDAHAPMFGSATLVFIFDRDPVANQSIYGAVGGDWRHHRAAIGEDG